jgi:hypothetical protein
VPFQPFGLGGVLRFAYGQVLHARGAKIRV